MHSAQPPAPPPPLLLAAEQQLEGGAKSTKGNELQVPGGELFLHSHVSTYFRKTAASTSNLYGVSNTSIVRSSLSFTSSHLHAHVFFCLTSSLSPVATSWKSFDFTTKESVLQYWDELEVFCVRRKDASISLGDSAEEERTALPEAFDVRNWIFQSISVQQRAVCGGDLFALTSC